MEVNASVGGERRGHSHLISMSEIGIDMEHGYILYIYIYITNLICISKKTQMHIWIRMSVIAPNGHGLLGNHYHKSQWYMVVYLLDWTFGDPVMWP